MASTYSNFNPRWGKASTQRAIAEAQLASPGVVEDLIEDAKSKDDVCDRCDDIGSVAAPPGLEGDIPGYLLAREASEEHRAIYARTCPKRAGEGNRTPLGRRSCQRPVNGDSRFIFRGQGGRSSYPELFGPHTPPPSPSSKTP